MNKLFMKNRIEINVNKIQNNIASIRRYTRNAPILAMVKSNAYGMGLKRIASILAKQGVTQFGVWGMREARLLRSINANWTIVNFTPLTQGDIQQASCDNITLVITRPEDVEILKKEYNGLSKPLNVFLKIDIDLKRWGLELSQILPIASKIASLKNVRIAALATTLSETSTKDKMAIQLLWRLQRKLAQCGIRIPYVSFASSHGILTLPPTNLGLTRPGIILFGIYPDLETAREKKIVIEPVWRLVSYIAQLRSLPPGTTLGYKLARRNESPITIAILPIGYANGYNSLCQGRSQVLVDGKRCPVLSVNMTSTIVDITQVDNPKLEQEVVLIGNQKNDAILLSDIAQITGLSPYVLMATLPNNIARKYIKA